AFLHGGAPPEIDTLKGIGTAGAALGVTVLSAEVRGPDGLVAAVATLTTQHADALWVAPSPLNYRLLKQIVEFASANRLPSMFGDRAYGEGGGLLSVWVDLDGLAPRD